MISITEICVGWVWSFPEACLRPPSPPGNTEVGYTKISWLSLFPLGQIITLLRREEKRASLCSLNYANNTVLNDYLEIMHIL